MKRFIYNLVASGLLAVAGADVAILRMGSDSWNARWQYPVMYVVIAALFANVAQRERDK